jgi:HEAT repeat protein
VEFSNRSGMSQDESIIADLEAALEDPDPVVSDVAIRTLVQILRFRAVRAAELDTGQAAVQKLVKIQNPVVIPVLIEILKNPRQGYLLVDGNLQEGSNGPARLLALIALVEFRTKEAQDVIRMRRFDKDPNIANAAERALEAFPGEWSGRTA